MLELIARVKVRVIQGARLPHLPDDFQPALTQSPQRAGMAFAFGATVSCIARLIRLRSTLHPPPGSGSFAFRFRAREDFHAISIIWN
jgi:hypothetical protein